MLQENILKEAQRLNKKIVMGYRMLDREFCEIYGEFQKISITPPQLFNGISEGEESGA